MASILRLIFITLSFLFISTASFTKNLAPDSLQLENIDSLSLNKLHHKDTSEHFNSLKHLNTNNLKFSLDSLNNISKIINNQLDNFPELSQDTLLNFRHQLVNAQETANALGKSIKEGAEADTLGLINESKNIYFTLGTLKGRVDDQLRKIENSAIKKKAGYIWTAPITVNTNDLYHSFNSALKNPKSIFTEISNSGNGGLILLLLISLGYYYWLFKNRQNSTQKTASKNVKNNFPVFESLLLFLILLPLFDSKTTADYIGIIQLLILLLVFWKYNNRVNIQSKRWWFSMIVIYILVLLFNYMIMSNGFIIRIIAIGLNLLSLSFGYSTITRLKRTNQYTRTYKIIFLLFVILNFIAVLLNIVGQINISKAASITAIIGAVQLVGLVTLSKLITENLDQQFEIIKKSKGFLSNINKTRIVSLAKKIMVIIGYLLWITVFIINLGIIDAMADFSKVLLNKPHVFGGLTFTLGNIIYCLIIVGIANWFQKNLDVLLSNRTNKSAKFEPQTEQVGTKVIILRLVIIILGFLLGVTALGISMDKLTVILGALSVGIGLGMQNIFNNFVSGVILIFEKPFKIGDYIELADKKGRVQKIGIRSSSLLTEQGSEVIIPNGDLLSGRLVNWTNNQSYYRCELKLKFSEKVSLEEIKQTLLEEIERNEYSIKEISPEILYNTISANDFELKVQCWIINIYKESSFKSSLLEGLRTKLIGDEIISLG